MKVAFVYDRVNKWGGAESVLLALHQLFPEAPLFTSVYNPKTAPWAKVFPMVIPSFLQKFPFATRHELYAPLMPLAFEQFNFDEYDLVISLTSEAAKGIITKPQTLHFCYCLTPTRYLWSGYEDYFRRKHSFQNSLLRFFSKPVVFYLRAWDKIAAARPDKFIAISKEVQKRIKKYYGRESVVIYPPVELGERGKGKGEREVSPKPYTLNPIPYFLVVSRLVPYKRVDLVIEAFNELGWPLKIVGTGSEFKKLKRKAKENIEFLGNLTEEELIKYYEECRAIIFAGVEDFGLSLVEAQLLGKPVIAYKKGGALESIIKGKTGEFFEPQVKEALMKVLKDFKVENYSQEECIENAKKFSNEKFKIEFMNFIKRRLK